MRPISLLIIFFFSNVISAQIKIHGAVVTSQNRPLEFAEITLFSEDAKPLLNQLTNEKGEFILDSKKGNYTLQIHQSDEILHTQTIELNSDFDAGIISVNPSKTIEEIVLTKRKKLVERKIDRLVFNIENKINATGGDALDALKMTPGVLIRNENISIIGKQTIRVLIDDKMLELGEADLANFLRSIPSDNIKSIEVITTPPAKYDAAGGSGLINIQLKKTKKDSWSLSLGSSYLRREEHGEGAVTSNLLHNKNNLSLSASLNYRDGGEYHDYQDYNSFPNNFWNTRQAFKRQYKRLNSVLGMQYSATPNWTFGFQYIANINNAKANRITRSSVFHYNNDTAFNEILSEINAAQKPKFNSLNLFNEIKLDSLGKKIILNLDHFNYSNFDTRPYQGTSVMNNPFTIQYFKGINNNQQRTNNFSGKVDIELPTTWANWSTGGKISASKTENDISAFNSGLINNQNPEMPQINNQYNYDENVQALYFSGNKKFSNKFEVQIGLRMEATQTRSYNENSNLPIDNNYTKLFPSLNVLYSANENSTYRLSYSKRIARPNFAELNPNVTYVTPFLSVEGNQVLRPYFVNNFDFFYTFKDLETKLYYSIENDVFNQVGLPNLDNGNIRLVYKNIFNIKRYGISETFTFDKLNWWNSINTLNINYSSAKTIDLAATEANGLTSFFTTNNDFNLNKKKTLLFNLSFEYYMFGNYGIDKIRPFTSTSFAIQYHLLDKDLKITFKANDIFKTDRFRFSSTVNGFHRNSDYYFDTRLFQLAINYKFGSKKVSVKKRQTGNEDERARTGN